MIILKNKLFAEDLPENLEDYGKFDDETLSKMTKNQLILALEEEGKKAQRNKGKIVSKYRKLRGDEGAERGKASGRKWGTGIGGALGAIVGKSMQGGSWGKAALGAAAGAALGRLAGRSIGKMNGRASGERQGAQEGSSLAKKHGHDSTDVLFKTARRFDDYSRKTNKPDDWEMNLKQELIRKKQEQAEAARRAREEAREERRLAAEERRAEAEERKSKAEVRNAGANLYDVLYNKSQPRTYYIRPLNN